MLLKKRILPLALSVIMAMSALTGCGSSSEKDSSSGAETTLTMWTIATESDSFHKPYLQAIKEFEKNHPGVKINMETFENESYKTKIKAAVAANELPDIFFTWSGGFSESFVSSGKVMCLDDYYKNYEKEISKTALANDIYDGKLYGSVTCTPVSVMWYNKEMFKKQGVEVPATWDDFKAVCKKFIDAGIKPIGTSVKDTWVLAMLHEELVDMGAFIDGATGLSNDEASASFYAEQVPMYFTGSWMGGSIVTDAEKPDNFAVAPIPVVNSKNASVTDFMGGGSDTLMVSANTKNKDLAAAAAFEITRGVSKHAYLSGAGIPAWTVDYDASSVPALTQQVADIAGKATSYTLWFDTLMSSDDAGEYLTLLQSLFAGDLKPEEFAASMDKQLSKK